MGKLSAHSSVGKLIVDKQSCAFPHVLIIFSSRKRTKTKTHTNIFTNICVHVSLCGVLEVSSFCSSFVCLLQICLLIFVHFCFFQVRKRVLTRMTEKKKVNNYTQPTPVVKEQINLACFVSALQHQQLKYKLTKPVLCLPYNASS